MINRFTLIGGLTTVSALLPACGDSAISSGKSSKPNVLFIIVDDLGRQDISFTGSEFYQTPNIDDLCRQSTFFSSGYAPYPRSVPSRYGMMTGMHPARPQSAANGIDDRKVLEDTYSIAEPFKASGYQTLFIGKWHLSPTDCLPQDKGFDINIGGGYAGAPISHFAPFNIDKSGNSGNSIEIVGMDDATEGEYLTDYMGRKMVSFLREKHNKPFFAVCSFYAVHTPIQAKEDLMAIYEERRKLLGLNDNSFIEEEAGQTKAQSNDPEYAAMVASVDEAVGDMLAALRESGEYDNTLIVFISDHGGLSSRGNKRRVATSNAPYKAGKGHLYEGGLRVPFAIHLPQQSVGIESRQLASGLDIMPTLVELCNLKTDSDVQFDGVSLAPVLKQEVSQIERKLFWHKADERPVSTGDYISSAMRSGDFKLIDFYLQDRVELYNIAQDPSESSNLVEQNPELASKMLKELNQWREQIDVIMADDNTTRWNRGMDHIK